MFSKRIKLNYLIKEWAKGFPHFDPNEHPKRPGQPPCSFYVRTGVTLHNIGGTSCLTSTSIVYIRTVLI